MKRQKLNLNKEKRMEKHECPRCGSPDVYASAQVLIPLNSETDKPAFDPEWDGYGYCGECNDLDELHLFDPEMFNETFSKPRSAPEVA